jgi:hypothetical protein
MLPSPRSKASSANSHPPKLRKSRYLHTHAEHMQRWHGEPVGFGGQSLTW